MGANNSKDSSRSGSSIQSINFKNKSQDLVDFGTIFPNGLYTTTPQDFDTRALRQLIINRKLAPFYKGLNDAPETVTISSLVSSPSLQPSSSLSTISTPPSANKNIGRPRSASNRSEKIQKSNNNNEKEPSHSERMKHYEAMLYNNAVECPICFLYYPPNINYSRCCDQPICTECFIQIHRPTDDPTNPATCPFCLESNYGITYRPPPWSSIQKQPQKRLRSFSSSSSLSSSNISLPPNNHHHHHHHHHDGSTGARHTTSGVSDERKPRRKSVSHTHPDVVLIDHIRPHWNKPAVSSTRSSRRNSLTNTSSSPRNLLRVVTRPGRSASSAASTEYNQYLANVRDMNMDLEEWMVMEAIRLSLQEHDDQQRNQSSQQQENENTSSNVTLSPSVATSDSSSSGSSVSDSNSNNNNSNANSTDNGHANNNNRNNENSDDDDDEQPLALRIPNYQQNEAYTTQQQNQQDTRNQCKSSSSSIKESSEVQQSTLNKKSSGHDPQTSSDILC